MGLQSEAQLNEMSTALRRAFESYVETEMYLGIHRDHAAPGLTDRVLAPLGLAKRASEPLGGFAAMLLAVTALHVRHPETFIFNDPPGGDRSDSFLPGERAAIKALHEAVVATVKTQPKPHDERQLLVFFTALARAVHDVPIAIVREQQGVQR